jgi:hypothetical protein
VSRVSAHSLRTQRAQRPLHGLTPALKFTLDDLDTDAHRDRHKHRTNRKSMGASSADTVPEWDISDAMDELMQELGKQGRNPARGYGVCPCGMHVPLPPTTTLSPLPLHAHAAAGEWTGGEASSSAEQSFARDCADLASFNEADLCMPRTEQRGSAGAQGSAAHSSGSERAYSCGGDYSAAQRGVATPQAGCVQKGAPNSLCCYWARHSPL